MLGTMLVLHWVERLLRSKSTSHLLTSTPLNQISLLEQVLSKKLTVAINGGAIQTTTNRMTSDGHYVSLTDIALVIDLAPSGGFIVRRDDVLGNPYGLTTDLMTLTNGGALSVLSSITGTGIVKTNCSHYWNKYYQN